MGSAHWAWLNLVYSCQSTTANVKCVGSITSFSSQEIDHQRQPYWWEYLWSFQPNFISIIINLTVLYLIFFFVELALLPLSPPTKKSILHNSRSIFGVYMYLPFGQARFNLTNGELLAQYSDTIKPFIKKPFPKSISL